MRSYVRTIIVIALAVGLFALFLRNVDLYSVGADIVRARPGWLAFALIASAMNPLIRAYRWQYLLEPLGRADYLPALKATAVGFAANAILPARAGEVIRPYFLARSQRRAAGGTPLTMNAAGAFATIVVERLLDVLTVILLLTVYVFVFGREVARAHPAAFLGLEWAAATATVLSIVGLAVLFVMAGNPERIRRIVEMLTRLLPRSLAATAAHIVEKFAEGLAIVRRPSRLAISLALSIPLWTTIVASIWGVAVAFDIAVPFAGTFLIVAFLSLGVAVPTPGAVGGFHAAFRYSTTTFFDARDEAAVGAAIVGHLFSIVPSLIMGLLFAAQEGLSVSGMRQLADDPGGTRPRTGQVEGGAV